MASRREVRQSAALIILFLALSSFAHAQSICSNSMGAPPGVLVGFEGLSNQILRTTNCLNMWRCYPPMLGGVMYSTQPPGCDPEMGTCAVRASVPTQFPGIRQNQSTSFPYTRTLWFLGATEVGVCGRPSATLNFWDEIEAWLQVSGFSCADPDATQTAGLYTMEAKACEFLTDCPKPTAMTSVNLEVATLEAIFCDPPPPPSGCGGDASCMACPGGGGGPGNGPGGPGAPGKGGGSGGGGAGMGVGGDGVAASPAGSGPGAFLRYRARGAGHPGHPGTAAHSVALGRYWSHDGAERIVRDPDDSHVWLITRYATFREFTDAGLDGDYEDASPSDEYRSLTKTSGATPGWELRFLEGTVQHFDNDGLWTQTVDPNGNVTIASYAGSVLNTIAFPDGRSETFTYHPGGKLATITEVGVDTVTTRTWSYTWSGNDLARIDRPDGTAWTFLYADVRYPGYLTRMTLEGTDMSERIARAWAYDDFANATASWAGAALDTDPGAVDLWRFAYDNPLFPSETQVTDPLGNVSTYTFDRDPASRKVRVTQLDGDCPTCGVGPNTSMAYDDALNPLRPTERIDGRGTITRMAWTLDGMLESRIEDFGGTLERETTWDYDPTFSSLVTEVEQPSTSGNTLDRRRTTFGYSMSGDQETRTIEGVEDGAAFVYSTVTTYTAEGVPDVVDPPGYGIADQTSFTYDPARGNVVVATRTDPLIGTTTFGYDPFNRRASVTDPNSVETETAYDDLDRARFLIQRGAMPADDLVTEHRYNVFGDLFQTVLPEGNVIEYEYDQAGRMVTIERKPDDQPTSHGERTVYTLNGFGHQTRTEQQRWDGMSWVVDAVTDQVYSTRCHLDQTIEGAGTANESVTEYAYDCDGNLERIWDANHPSAGQTAPATTVYSYDALDRLETVTQPFGTTGTNAVTTYGYDVQDHLESVEDAEGTVTSYVYSDRDLMTQEVSEVSGTTANAYNEHGELVTRLDARGVLETRNVDALDRVTFVDFPDNTRDIAYTYDDAMVPFSLGRLTSIARDGGVVDYGYDRFGRVTQDGALVFGYDQNGNRASIGYPGGAINTVVTFDFADREDSVTVQQSWQSDVLAASNATYFASGPLRALDLGSGVSESRLHDARYHPDRITASGGATLLDWDYTTDAVGNIASIADVLTPANDRTYGYLDHQYFLTQGDGPWGTRSWTYDAVGNRLTEDRDGVAMDVYSYMPNLAMGNSPKLDQIDQTAIGVITSFAYDAAGNQTQATEGVQVTTFAYDDASRLSRIERAAADAASDLVYDGRSYLRRAEASSISVLFEDGFESNGTACWDNTVPGPPTGTCPPKPITGPTYSSDGVLQHVAKEDGTERRVIVYLAGRPVAILAIDAVGTPTYTYLTADHLGTPVLATDAAGVALWDGGFEPFGADYDGASGVGMFLRFPGQWVDEAWGDEEAYNVHRWYRGSIGGYTRVDPLGVVDQDTFSFSSDSLRRTFLRQLFTYAEARPLLLVDSLGLKSRVCCRGIPATGNIFKHCYIDVRDAETGVQTTFGVHGGFFQGSADVGAVVQNAGFDRAGKGKCGPWIESCAADACVEGEASSYPSPNRYRLIRGPNSNTFAGTVSRSCQLEPPKVAGTNRTPGWNDPPAPPATEKP